MLLVVMLCRTHKISDTLATGGAGFGTLDLLLGRAIAAAQLTSVGPASVELKTGEWALTIGSLFGFENTVTAVVGATSRSLPRYGNNCGNKSKKSLYRNEYEREQLLF